MIHVGDCLEVMRTLDANSVDAVICDPPYGLGFMGKAWDHGVPGEPFWREALRVAKPGAHLLAFGGTRTFHRLACAIEDSGWELRDTLMWVYGSGFPKSLDVSKAIDKAAGAEREVLGPNLRRHGGGLGVLHGGGIGADVGSITAPATEAARQWQGWGTALKPAWEPIIMARKPLVGTVAANVQAHRTGALNIDGCRVENPDYDPGAVQRSQTAQDGHTVTLNVPGHEQPTYSPIGRWPANLIHDGSDEVVALFPQSKDGIAGKRTGENGVGNWGYGPQGEAWGGYGGEGSAARFFYCAKADREDRNDGCEGLPLMQSGMVSNTSGQHITRRDGGAPPPSANHHPTVKPTDLMRWLCRLVTPPGGLVLDPFTGSGSTGRAAIAEGMRFVGIELDPAYATIAEARIRAIQPGLSLAGVA